MEDAYQAGVKYRKRTESLEQENESLRGLIGANIRVTEQEAEKRMNPLPWCETLNEPYYKINLRLCFSREGWKEKQAGQPMSVIIPWIDKLIEEDKKQV
jgi:hypothetical protein